MQNVGSYHLFDFDITAYLNLYLHSLDFNTPRYPVSLLNTSGAVPAAASVHQHLVLGPVLLRQRQLRPLPLLPRQLKDIVSASANIIK